MQQSRRSLSLNDETDYGLCFACGPRNDCGLRLQFVREGDTVKTTYSPTEHLQGFPGYAHGGVIGTLLDEVMSRVSVLENRWTMTARMDVRFRRPVLTGQTVTAVGEKVRERRGFYELAAAWCCRMERWPPTAPPCTRRFPTLRWRRWPPGIRGWARSGWWAGASALNRKFFH